MVMQVIDGQVSLAWPAHEPGPDRFAVMADGSRVTSPRFQAPGGEEAEGGAASAVAQGGGARKRSRQKREGRGDIRGMVTIPRSGFSAISTWDEWTPEGRDR
ncbi:hypothetical protein ACIRP2_25095 [Streptomyces sp. NPDC101194]|uniref:hypothetical protein n=1 Tax=Streptomyces sp. NPDC101194 TaxID=3366127 RepID=UPI0037FED42C